MIVVVLGTHRSGSSLVANVLQQLGVKMGDMFPTPNRWNPWGYWEDTEFIRLNGRILRKAGGKWSRPPLVHRIDAAGLEYADDISEIIERKSLWLDRKGRRWGFKDPRTCLTARCYMPHWGDRDVRFIKVERRKSDIVRSLMRRSRQSRPVHRRRWDLLTTVYLKRIDAFIEEFEVDHYTVRFEDLINERTARKAVIELGWYLGMKRFGRRARRALKAIHYR